MSETFETPDEIQDVLTDEENANIESRDGWAVGVVQRVSDGNVVDTFRPAFIELFNSDGRAGEFGGVRFMATTDGEQPFEEAYAYATETAGAEQGGSDYYVVTEYLDPEEPDYGTPAP